MLKTLDPVVPGSVTVYQTAGGTLVVITCTASRGIPERLVDQRIQDKEPIALIYPADAIGLTAPRIFSERSDFPRDLPHLNPVEPTSPSSLCIARHGTQALYDQGGIRAVIREISEWLTDAAAGTLEHDGWESYPLPDYFQASMNRGAWQKEAYNKAGKSAITCYSIADTVSISRDGVRVRIQLDVDDAFMSLGDLLGEKLEYEIISDEEERLAVPCAFICGPRTATTDFRAVDVIHNKEGLLNLADKAGCAEQVQRFLTETRPRIHEKHGASLCLMIGLWRPKPLIADISSSSGGMGAHLEIFAFALWLEKKGDLSSISVCPLRILSVPTAKLRATLSGLEEPPVPCAIIGNGALGSKISSFLAREGIEHLSLVDPDIFNPHNVVRNELGRPSIGLYKAKELKNDIEFKFANDRQQGGITCRARVTNIHSSKEKISEIVGPKTKWLIDSTADKRAFNYLCNKKQSYPVVRVEMVDQGRIGVLLAEGPSRNPRLDDLQATLYSLAAERDLLAKWLAKDQALPNILIGQGCTSDTLILADFQVASHAASFMPAINKRLSGTAQAGGIGLNVLHEDGTPAGWSWIHVPEFIEMKLERYNGKEDWTLRIHPDAYNFIQAEMKKHTETEAGGYMYGRYDIHKRIVTITHAFWTPPIEATATKLKLPPASSTMPEREFMEKTNGKLIPMGSWHSHLDGAPKMSATDEDQARKFAKDNTQTPHPVVMLIVSTRGQTGYVIYPENWT